MKHMSKILALVLALVMTLSLAITVSAAEGDITISITTSDSGASVAGHTYEVYQIFTGDVATDGKTLSNAEFGENYKPAGKTVQEAMEEISGKSPTEAAAFLADAVTGGAIKELNDENGHEAEVAPGYYLIVDVTEGDSLEDSETTSAFILQVLEPTEIKSKHTAGPIVEKKIDDTNDSLEAENEIVWHDSADHDIGDLIPFQLKMTVPAIINQFVEYDEAYKFVFHDTEETGLTFQNDAKVYVDGVEITEGFEVQYPAEDGHTFDVVFADLTNIAAVKAGSVITVEYHSELNENAVLGSTGNVNEVFGEFSNLHDEENPGFTPKDTVIAFTYKVIVNKYDDVGEKLAGAEFTLEKYDAATEGWTAIEVVKTEEGKVFTFKGLDDGNYRLTETVTPNGYNTIDPIEFTVTADHDLVWETQGRTDVLNTLTGNVETGEIEFTSTLGEGSLSTDVVNEKGVVLPETGGIGTTIFYALGGLLVVVAVVLLVTKKRMASDN